MKHSNHKQSNLHFHHVSEERSKNVLQRIVQVTCHNRDELNQLKWGRVWHSQEHFPLPNRCMLIAFSFFSGFFKSLIIPVMCPAHFHLDLILAKYTISVLPNPCSQSDGTECLLNFPEWVLYNLYSSHLLKSCEQGYNIPYEKLTIPFGKKKFLPSLVYEWARTESHQPWPEIRGVVLGHKESSKFVSGMVYNTPWLWSILYFQACKEISIIQAKLGTTWEKLSGLCFL